MSNTFKDRLNKAILEKGIKPAELSRRTGIHKSSITAWLKGDYEAKQDNIFKLSKALDVSEAWLMGLDDSNKENQAFNNRNTPNNKHSSHLAYKELKGAIAAGLPLEMFEVPDIVQVPIDVDVAFPKAYFLIVKGDSMNKVISEGMYALIDPCEELNNGEIGVIRVNGTEATLKRFYRMGGYIMLQPESTNPEHKNQIYTTKEEIEMISILGKLVWAMTPIGMKF